ncbi:hypothetical protein ACWEKT_26720 [Nocardia takedensis]
MSDSQQLPLDIEVEQTPWGKWVDPDRRAAQVAKFMKYAGLQQLPVEPWEVDSFEVKRLDPFVAYLFPSLATAMAPESADMADAFICFIGECFIKYAGAQWVEYDWFGRDKSFYDQVNPGLLFDNHDEDEFSIWGLMDNIIGYHPGDHDGMFSYFAAALREYRGYHQDKLRDDLVR